MSRKRPPVSAENMSPILTASNGSENNIPMDAAEKHPGYTLMGLEVGDLNTVQSALEQKRIPVSGGPVSLPGGTRFLFDRGPDGNAIELSGPGA